MKGEIKFFSKSKGYGFVIGDDNKEYFTHISQINEEETPFTGDKVKFKPMETKRGLQARDLIIIK